MLLTFTDSAFVLTLFFKEFLTLCDFLFLHYFLCCTSFKIIIFSDDFNSMSTNEPFVDHETSNKVLHPSTVLFLQMDCRWEIRPA